MRSTKLWSSRAKEETGSAVVDFITLTIPVSLIGLVVIDVFGLAQSALFKVYLAFELARRISLADVSSTDIQYFQSNIYPNILVRKSQSSDGCMIFVSANESFDFISYLEPKDFLIEKRALCENQ